MRRGPDGLRVLGWVVTTLFVAAVVAQIALALDPATRFAIGSLMLIVWVASCWNGFARTDPVAFVSLVVPLIALFLLGLAVLASGRSPGLLLGLLLCAGGLWLAVWAFAPARLWRWWSRSILRRRRPDSVEMRVWERWREIRVSWANSTSPEDADQVRDRISALGALRTDRTRPVIDGITALWDLSYAGTRGRDRFERADARLQQEWEHLWEPPRLRLPGRPARSEIVRPTRATCLEYAYPRLEALFATARPDQHRVIAVASAQLALRRAGLTDPAIDRLLASAAAGRPEASTLALIEARLAPAYERVEEIRRAAARPIDGSYEVALGEATALSATVQASADELSAIDVANLLYEIVRIVDDIATERAFEDLIIGIVGPDAAASAVEIQPSHVAA